MSPQVREAKVKVRKWEYIKLKIFPIAQKSINKMKKAAYWMGEYISQRIYPINIQTTQRIHAIQHQKKKKKRYSIQLKKKMARRPK